MSQFQWQPVSPIKIWAEPNDEGQTIKAAIAGAKYSVDIAIYELGGPMIMDALKLAKANGTTIRIMFNGQFFAGPDKSNRRYDQVYYNITELEKAAGNGELHFHWASNNFSITHQKTIIIDAIKDGILLEENELPDTAKVLVLTMNLCQYGWMVNNHDLAKAELEPMPWLFWQDEKEEAPFPLRNFGAVVTTPELVVSIAKVFESDFNGAAANDTNDLKTCNNGLVWSNGTTGIPGYYPNGGAYPAFNVEQLGAAVDEGNARETHMYLINNTKSTLVIYNEEMNDEGIVNALIAAAKRGVDIKALLTGNTKLNSDKSKRYYEYYDHYNNLTKNGVQIRLFPASSGVMYIHAKMLLADYDTANCRAFMGSQNFSGNSLNFNRELGIMLSGNSDTELFHTTFAKDWNTDGLITWPNDGRTLNPPSPIGNYPLYLPGTFSDKPMLEGKVQPREN